MLEQIAAQRLIPPETAYSASGYQRYGTTVSGP
jgi:hypothetical protein